MLFRSIAGNAGAYGGDMAGVVETVRAWLGPHETGSPAENGPEPWARMTEIPVADMGYAYRTSRLKRGHGVVLGARLRLRRERPDVILARIDSFEAARRQKQPTERSCGSIFRNPPGEVAGRLLEDAGMKGRSRGDAQVSPIHANWIINRGTASAMDVAWLMKQGQTEVLARAGIQLHLEVLLVGEWDPAVVDALVEAPTACPTTGNSGLPPLPPLPTREGGFTTAAHSRTCASEKRIGLGPSLGAGWAQPIGWGCAPVRSRWHATGRRSRSVTEHGPPSWVGVPQPAAPAPWRREQG